ncbi:MAG: hypothetical protein ACI4U2_05605 [Christensenellaceae bacterium]
MFLIDRYRAFKRALLKKRIKRQEKTYGGDFPLRYYLERHSSRDLIVVYSAFPEHGKAPAYNYVSTLEKLKVNKLFILDEYGVGRGCYYLGKDGNFSIERSVKELISQVQTECRIERTVHVGSSKGGWAALHFALASEGDVAVMGGPQYRLGSYLMRSEMENLLDWIMGGRGAEEIDALDRLLPDQIKEARPRAVFLHYSDAEHTYEDSVKPMLFDLERAGYPVVKDVSHYTRHADVGVRFAEYLPDMLRTILA